MVVMLFSKLHSASCPIKMTHQLISFSFIGEWVNHQIALFSLCEIGREHFRNHISHCDAFKTLEKIHGDQLMTKTNAIYSELAVPSSQSSLFTFWQRLRSRQRSGEALYRKKKEGGRL